MSDAERGLWLAYEDECWHWRNIRVCQPTTEGRAMTWRNVWLGKQVADLNRACRLRPAKGVG